jgi:hypothetical protein
MTLGEKMVWAVAFVSGCRDSYLHPGDACDLADSLVAKLRFGGRGDGWSEMVETADAASDRGDKS